MGYSQTFSGTDKDEVLKQAQAFVEKLDMVQQAYIWAVNESKDGWVIIVNYYGFD
jgi:hypothetical protein